jgi:hypothetical protein
MAGSDDQLGFGFIDMCAAVLHHPIIAGFNRTVALHRDEVDPIGWTGIGVT